MEALRIDKRRYGKDGEGDVVLVFGKPYPMETTVSRKVLTDASPVLKEMLESGASDEAPRSAANPQRLAISDDVSTAHMDFFCAILHGLKPAADYPGPDEHTWLSLLGGVAIIAKEFRAVDALKGNIAPLLLDPLEKTTTHTCVLCPKTKRDPGILTAIGERLTPKLTMWPPRYVTEHSLRQVITAMHSLGNSFQVENSPYQICKKHINPLVRAHTSLRQFADVASHQLLGLCLKCTQAGRPQFGDSEHLKAMADRIVSLDPIG